MHNDPFCTDVIYVKKHLFANRFISQGRAALVDEPGLTIYADVHLLHLPEPETEEPVPDEEVVAP